MKRKAIWITGASSGMGKELALEFSRNKHIVIISSRREDELNLLQKQILLEQNECFVCQLDITQPDQILQKSIEIVKDFEIECLINNAGIALFKPAHLHSFTDVSNIINTNLIGAIYLINSTLPSMIENENGIIINTISVVVEKTFKNCSVYSASKAGLLAYCKSLREEVRDNNIKIINILPGATSTEIWDKKSLEKFGNRMMNPKDIAKLVYQLFSLRGSVVPEEVILRPIKGDL